MLGFAPLAARPLDAGPEPVTESRWHRPFAEPARTRVAALSIALISTSFASIGPVGNTQPEQVTESRWHQGWSEPVRVRAGLPAHLQAAAVLPVFTGAPAPPPTYVAWLVPFAEPVRTRPGLAAAFQPGPAALVEAAPFGETVTEDRWHQP